MKKIMTVVVSAILLATTFTGCGNKSEAGGKVKVIDIELTSEQYAFGVDKNQPELLEKANSFIKQINEDGTFEEICNKYFGEGTKEGITSAVLDESKDQLVVATNAAFEPFEYTKGDTYYGIDMEVAKAFAESLNKELVIQNMDFSAVCLSVGQHKCDIAMAGLTIKPDREEHVSFTEPYYNASQKLIVKADNTEFDECKTKEDVEAILKQKESSVKVGVQNGTTGQFYCQGDEDWGFEGFKMETVGFQNGSLAVQDLLNGNISYVVIDSAPATCITESINKLQ